MPRRFQCSRARSKIMQSMKRARTAPKEVVARLPEELEVRLERKAESLPGRPGFVIPAGRTVLFVS